MLRSQSRNLQTTDFIKVHTSVHQLPIPNFVIKNPWTKCQHNKPCTILEIINWQAYEFSVHNLQWILWFYDVHYLDYVKLAGFEKLLEKCLMANQKHSNTFPPKAILSWCIISWTLHSKVQVIYVVYSLLCTVCSMLSIFSDFSFIIPCVLRCRWHHHILTIVLAVIIIMINPSSSAFSHFWLFIHQMLVTVLCCTVLAVELIVIVIICEQWIDL